MFIKKLTKLAGISLLAASIIGVAAAPLASAAPLSFTGISAPPTVSGRPGTPMKGVQAPKGQPNLADPSLSTSNMAAPSGTATTLSAPVPQYFYGGGLQTVVADGAFVNLNVQNPYLNSNDSHSLAELAIQSGDSKQIVEVGWTKDATICGAYTPGSSGPCLFTFSWINGVGQGYNTGFVDNASVSLNVGATLPAPLSGNNTRFGIQSSSNLWWVAVDVGDGTGGKWIGYFPQTLWSNATPSVTFTKSGLIQAFGEVAAKATGDNTPCTDMGNGVLGLNVNGTAARVGSYSVVNPPAGVVSNLSLTGTSQSYPGKYYTEIVTPNTPGNITTLRYGGPGYNAAGTGNGVAGGC